jgi:L-asparaginase II
MDGASLHSGSVPLVEVTRGRIVESIHSGVIVVVDEHGKILAGSGSPDLVTFMRSSAKPFQALPFVEAGGDQAFKLEQEDLALICASHSGTDAHVKVARRIQERVGISESDLKCGSHPPYDKATWKQMQCEDAPLTANRNNCSGKHSGMLAYAKILDAPLQSYLNVDHPVQQAILAAFARMCGIEAGHVELGTDGCSAPNFAVPLYNAALGFARLCAGGAAEGRITTAMTAYPEMVGGPGRFDTILMRVTKGRIVSKAGAEGYQCFGFMPGVLGPGSPAAGAALKILDGDLGSRGRVCAAMEVLRQLGAVSKTEQASLTQFGPCTLENWQGITVGAVRPAFKLG